MAKNSFVAEVNLCKSAAKKRNAIKNVHVRFRR